MPYNEDKTWLDIAKALGVRANNLIIAIDDGVRQYDEWQSFRAGRSNAEIATALVRTETEIAEMDAAFSAFVNIKANCGGTGTLLDQYYSLRKFS